MDLRSQIARLLMGDQAWREKQAQALALPPSPYGDMYYPPTISRAGAANPYFQRDEEKEAKREDLVNRITREIGPPPPGFWDLQRNLEMRKSIQENQQRLLQEALKQGV